MSCLTCLGQLKCLHLKQNYSIVNHNELQSLGHKRGDISGAEVTQKVRNIPVTLNFEQSIGISWLYLCLDTVNLSRTFFCPTRCNNQTLFHSL